MELAGGKLVLAAAVVAGLERLKAIVAFLQGLYGPHAAFRAFVSGRLEILRGMRKIHARVSGRCTFVMAIRTISEAQTRNALYYVDVFPILDLF